MKKYVILQAYMDPEIIDKLKKFTKILSIIIFFSVTVIPLLLKGKRDGYSAGLIILIMLLIAIPGILYAIARIAQKMAEKRRELDVASDHTGNFALLSGGVGKAILIALGIILVFFIIAYFIPMPYKMIALLAIAYILFGILYSAR
jgi:hypothetical protein